MAKIVGINFESIVDGECVRVVVFFAGCNHHCKGCHNPASHDFDAGRPFDVDIQENIVEYIRETPYVDGVTLSGGDPMYSADEVREFVVKLKSELPDINIWIYSGFTFEEILCDEKMLRLLQLCDVLFDGPFIMEQRDISLSYKGSRNQRIIDVQASLFSGGEVVLWKKGSFDEQAGFWNGYGGILYYLIRKKNS